MNIQIFRYNTITSTNDEAVRQAELGAAEGVCVVASSQSQGKGREGRTWHSEEGGGLYFSIILRPPIEEQFYPVMTLLGAVAVYDTVHTLTGAVPDIKWPNDVLVNEKKISGILAERCESNIGPAIVLGIGINFVTDFLTEDVRANATSLSDISDEDLDFEVVLRTLTHCLSYKYERFKSLSNVNQVLGDWSVRSSYSRDKSVRVRTRTDEFTGTTMGLNPYGSLMVRREDGGLSTVTAGDVTAVRALEAEVEESPKDVNDDELCENEID
ncbi:MAG: biotin--[acetyl-CoA-carboxylase] ligase [Pyrinomonadaceae bacterium]|nr:biotin--[acetyl-CoA-carboxylase] ligase [Pyrinomonadaceae bacterium]